MRRRGRHARFQITRRAIYKIRLETDPHVYI